MAGRERWRVGHVDALQPDDESPFALGNLRSGEARLAVDANLFRAAAEAHAPAGEHLLASHCGHMCMYGVLYYQQFASSGLATDPNTLWVGLTTGRSALPECMQRAWQDLFRCPVRCPRGTI